MKKVMIIIGLLALFYSSRYGVAGDDMGFRFVRIVYDDIDRNIMDGGFGRGGRGGGFRGGGRVGMWATDWPTADLNLHEAIARTTEIKIMGDPLTFTFLDTTIFEYPVVYLTEPGYWLTNEQEVKNIRKYLDRGGFFIIDDFHDYGGYGREWYNMYTNMKQVFPEREPIPLEADHPIWSIYYDIDPVEAPSTKPGFSKFDDQYYAFFDDNGRIMCIICYNQDISDGWEWPLGRVVTTEASTVSFQMGINFIIYALTH